MEQIIVETPDGYSLEILRGWFSTLDGDYPIIEEDE